jgi:hypothetical protein
VSLPTAEAELQMLCEGSLATEHVGMLLKETTKPPNEILVDNAAEIFILV